MALAVYSTPDIIARMDAGAVKAVDRPEENTVPSGHGYLKGKAKPLDRGEARLTRSSPPIAQGQTGWP